MIGMEVCGVKHGPDGGVWQYQGGGAVYGNAAITITGSSFAYSSAAGVSGWVGVEGGHCSVWADRT